MSPRGEEGPRGGEDRATKTEKQTSEEGRTTGKRRKERRGRERARAPVDPPVDRQARRRRDNHDDDDDDRGRTWRTKIIKTRGRVSFLGSCLDRGESESGR